MSSPPDDGRDHWPRHARQWALVGPPLRPAPEDVAIVTAEIAAWTAARGRAPRALLLGVTPELATMAWPAGSTLLAVDRAAAMIGAIFPRAGLPVGATAMVGDWLALPRAARSFDVVVGDGCLSCLAYPAGYRAVAAELRRVLADDGLLLLRLFAAPPQPEPLAEVAAALRAGHIGSLHALKWRLAMAIQAADRNVRVIDIWHAFEQLVPDRAALAAATGWPLDVIGTIDAYRGSEVVYSFPTADEVRAALDETFSERATHTPTYELGARCLTLALAPRR